MTINHHPPEDLLASFAVGKLDEAEHLVVAVHLDGCRRCRGFVQAVEQLAGASLQDVEPAPMAVDAFDRIMSRIQAEPVVKPVERALAASAAADPDLPDALHRYRIGKLRRVAPGVTMQPIELTGTGKSRAFLLRSAPGTRMLEHTHDGTELTCVLKGSFSHQGGHYGPGDFDYGDDDVDHRPVVGDDGPCVCLVAMTGNLRMNSVLGRLISPFIRL